jgi:quinol-cytochrome oxidoreductase complex cytochrome b subunit
MTTTATGNAGAAPDATRAARRPWPRRTLDAVDERMGITALRYPVPEHANNVAWSLGGITAVSFAVLLTTGVYLAQFYNPMPEVANQSIRAIVDDVWIGGFVRGVHYWAAQAMYVLAALHLLRVFFSGSYRRPREGNWLIGVSMFALTIGAIFTGTVLKWDQEGFEALGHNIELAELLGGLGFWFTPDVAKSVPILVRLYNAHVVIIPGLILVLLTLHALLVKRHGISPHPKIAVSREVSEPFTHHLRRVAAFGAVAMGVVGMLAVLQPPVVGPTPVEGIEVTRPPWIFWWMFTLENWFGLPAILWGAGLFFVLLVLLPFLDRDPARHRRPRRTTLVIGVLVLTALVVLTAIMAVTPTETHL